MMKPPMQETSPSQCQSLYAPWVKTLALENIFSRITRLDVAGDTCAWNRFLGGALLALVVLLFLSGGFLALYYSPVPGAAYVNYIFIFARNYYE